MSFSEINLYGIYVAPIAPLIMAAWLLMIPVRRFADRFALLRHVWHPALFLAAVYLILLSVIVLLAGGLLFGGGTADGR